MKVLFMRHGEAVDDVEDRYGGWADYPLTAKGSYQIGERSIELEKLGVLFEKIYYSPLSRAAMAATVLSNNLHIDMEVFEYLKERNYYGVLSGMKKSEAITKYPDIVATMKREEYIDGSERLEDFEIRVRNGVELLLQKPEQIVLIVTHGNWLKAFFKLYVHKELVKREDGGWVLGELDQNSFTIQTANGLEWE